MTRDELWTILRGVLSMGAAIEREEKDSTYERWSARLDGKANFFADQLETLLKSQRPCDPAAPSSSPSTPAPEDGSGS